MTFIIHSFKAVYEVRKQQYLEALSWLGAGGRPSGNVAWKPKPKFASSSDDELALDMEIVTKLLKSLEGFCSPLVYDLLSCRPNVEH